MAITEDLLSIVGSASVIKHLHIIRNAFLDKQGVIVGVIMKTLNVIEMFF